MRRRRRTASARRPRGRRPGSRARCSRTVPACSARGVPEGVARRPRRKQLVYTREPDRDKARPREREGPTGDSNRPHATRACARNGVGAVCGASVESPLHAAPVGRRHPSGARRSGWPGHAGSTPPSRGPPPAGAVAARLGVTHRDLGRSCMTWNTVERGRGWRRRPWRAGSRACGRWCRTPHHPNQPPWRPARLLGATKNAVQRMFASRKLGCPSHAGPGPMSPCPQSDSSLATTGRTGVARANASSVTASTTATIS
jgi:hypothetical protein